jgi:acyl-coenzyme A thioesterase PaaI-like protein
MTGFVPQDEAYADRVRASFARQAMMGTIGASLTRVAPGEVDVEVAVSPAIGQQHGFVHAGAVATAADSAAGYAALTLMRRGPAS